MHKVGNNFLHLFLKLLLTMKNYYHPTLFKVQNEIQPTISNLPFPTYHTLPSIPCDYCLANQMLSMLIKILISCIIPYIAFKVSLNTGIIRQRGRMYNNVNIANFVQYGKTRKD